MALTREQARAVLIGTALIRCRLGDDCVVDTILRELQADFELTCKTLAYLTGLCGAFIPEERLAKIAQWAAEELES